MEIGYLDAPPGSGKTYAVMRRIHHMVGEQRSVILSQPTHDLLNATADALTEQLPTLPKFVVHGGTHPGRVVEAITKHLLTPFPEPHLLLLTHQAVAALPDIKNVRKWDLFVDEAPGCIDEISLELAETHALISPHLRAVDDGTSPYVPVYCTSKIRKLAKAAHSDMMLKGISKELNALSSKQFSYFAPRLQYGLFKDGARRSVTLHGLLNLKRFTRFRTVTFASANFEKALLRKWIEANGHSLAACTWPELRYKSHENGPHLTVFYAFNQKWSKHLRDDDERRALEQLKSETLSLFGDRPFLWSANNDVRDTLFAGSTNAHRLPGKPHGMNSYQSFHDMAYLTAANPTPQHGAFLQRKLGMSRDELYVGVHVDGAYQALMRTSARVPDDAHPKRWIVPDKPTADFLHEAFPGSSIRQLPISWQPTQRKVGRRAKHASGTERVAAHRRSQAIAQDMKSAGQAHLLASGLCVGEGRDAVRDFRASYFKSKYDRPDDIIFGTFDEFTAYLRENSEVIYRNKAAIPLVSPAYFFPEVEGVTTSKGGANVCFANDLWLDIDGGDLSPEGLAYMLPSLRMVQYATYSSLKACLRFRVVIPLARTVDGCEYELLVKAIIAKAEESGCLQHAIEHKYNACSLFKLPCMPARKSGAFFADLKENRSTLDVDFWLSKIKAKSLVPEHVVHRLEHELPCDDRTKELLSRFRARSRTPGNGDTALYLLGSSLAAAGIAEQELRAYLLTEAQNMRSPADRVAQVPRIIESLRKHLKL